jgi:hypothetical protein
VSIIWARGYVGEGYSVDFEDEGVVRWGMRVEVRRLSEICGWLLVESWRV